ncbi:MAG: molybdopterin biosynthesis protein [Planctomycetes bacterium]|nr:molybdopterin biosynthesis protein [Planctomycetota bacterium]
MKQEQFLNVIDRDEAERRFHAAIRLDPLGAEIVPLCDALGRILAEDVVSPVDVPSFDRSNLDGFAVQAADTFGATEEEPRRLMLSEEAIATAIIPKGEVTSGAATSIATGGMLPRGADAIVMVEHADIEGGVLLVRSAVTSGFGVTFAGTDICSGETILRQGELFTSRETGVVAAVGVNKVNVCRRAKVAVISTGDEIIEPGKPMRPGLVYDSNAQIISDAVRELGGDPLVAEIVRDDFDQLRRRIAEALETTDIVVLSGGTSKGHGDLCYRVVSEFDDPGIVAHGVALKPGKPICLAASKGKPVVILPGFPTSAIFTFHEFVAPVIRRLCGRSSESRTVVPARMAVKVNSEIGRTEYLLVGLVDSTADSPSLDHSRTPSLSAYPMGKGSGSVTTFSRADGFVTIDRHEEIIDAGADVKVQLLGRELRLADLVVIGSHCVGLDFLLGRLQTQGFKTKFLAVGSTAGLEAAKRGECDIAGVHLLDSSSGEYNRPFLTPELKLIDGYRRKQGVVFRRGDKRFEERSAQEAIAAVKADAGCIMVNRNQGSGTRILIDQLLDGAKPTGYAVQARNHNAVAAAVTQERADWGVAIQNVSDQAALGFLPLTDEHYDFVVPESRWRRPAIEAFRKLLADNSVRNELSRRGFES